MTSAFGEVAEADTPGETADTGPIDRSGASPDGRPTPAAAVRRVALRIDPSRLCGAHEELARRLRQAGLHVSLIRGRAHDALPGSARLLLLLERMLHRIPAPRLSDPVDATRLAMTGDDDAADVVLDFCGDEARGTALRVLYDGAAGEATLFGALVSGRMPVIDIEDAATGAILASGVPAKDNAATIVGALECVLARAVTLAQGAICAPRKPGTIARRPARSATLRDLIAFEAQVLAGAIAHRLYALCFHTPHWRTCWRFVDGPDLWGSPTLAGTSWTVLPDPGFRFYADPFPFIHQGRTCVFVEDLDHRSNKGVISVVPFGPPRPTGPAEPVLEEAWHLSYPFVFEQAGQIWMIPESSADRTVRLYRAERFPDRWVEEATLLSDIAASDATVIRHDGLFWMFAATRDGFGSWSDTLSLFHAPRLLGPWQAHPANPVLVDQAAARPAGGMVVRNGRLWRPVQDCTAGYGCGIGLAEVTRLDRERFEQHVRFVLQADPAWPGRRFHTLNRAGRLECIDGSAYSLRSRNMARRLESWSGRREMPADAAPGRSCPQ
jgi:hypothetical protein